MIISASRRTDIPAFYSDWFYNRVEEGYCDAANPFNPNQVKRVSLKPEDVDAFVFWSRYTKRFREGLPLLDEKGYRYYFLITVVDYGKELEPNIPPFKDRIDEFIALSKTVGKERVIWRYDPIFIDNLHTFEYHISLFRTISSALSGYTEKVIISFADFYRKVIRNLKNNSDLSGIVMEPENEAGFGNFNEQLIEAAAASGMSIQSCAERIPVLNHGIAAGRCIDAELINSIYGLDIPLTKDKGQRKLCQCHSSVDIGAYNTCLHGCLYCYATNKFTEAQKNYELHSPAAAQL